MKLAIVGSRSFDDYGIMCRYTDMVCRTVGCAPDTIISGGARGADALAERYAAERGIPTEIYRADWNKYGRGAGFRRNITIIRNCDVCVAFWDGESHGTAHDIGLCKTYGKRCFVCKYLEWGRDD